MAKRQPKDFKERVRQVLKQAETPSRTRKQPRTGSLPGMEDHAIKALDLVAADYADIRDSRMDLTRQEVDLKSRALKLMKKYGKTTYKHNGVSIEIVAGDESIKVRVKVPSEEPNADDPKAPEDAPDDAGTESVELSE